MNETTERVLTDYEKFDLILKNIDRIEVPEKYKNQMRLAAIKVYEKSNRTGEIIRKAEALEQAQAECDRRNAEAPCEP